MLKYFTPDLFVLYVLTRKDIDRMITNCCPNYLQLVQFFTGSGRNAKILFCREGEYSVSRCCSIFAQKHFVSEMFVDSPGCTFVQIYAGMFEYAHLCTVFECRSLVESVFSSHIFVWYLYVSEIYIFLPKLLNNVTVC